jgi:hypothetical protein
MFHGISDDFVPIQPCRDFTAVPDALLVQTSPLA